MDPSHITEFASERYFSKLNQIGEPGSSTQTHDGGALVNQATTQTVPPALPGPLLPPIQPQSKFILPLRASRSLETDGRTAESQKKPERKGLFGLRSKLLHSREQQHSVHDSCLAGPPRGHSISTEPPAQSSVPLDQLFLNLPNELQIHIINSLPLADILNLRLASKSWHALITLNEAPIVRYHLDHHIPAYALRLYPVSDASKVSFHHLCGLWHRLHVVSKLSCLMCEWITKDMFLRRTKAQQQEFAAQRERMYRRLVPLLFTIFHFFETYRKLHLQYILDHDGHGLGHVPYTINPIEAHIMSIYDDQTLLKVHQVFPLVISSFCRQLRPPTYIGRVERSLRGYYKDKPSDEVHVAILCLGGLRQVERLWEVRGYNSRRASVDNWYSSITREPAPKSKPKRSLMSLGRKKSIAALKHGNCMTDTHPSTSLGTAWTEVNTNGHQWSDVVENGPDMMSSPSLVFSTSLAAGMPMSPLSSEYAGYLLRDLPHLQSIWLTTAEALILDRKIVARSQDILRNTQLMLELIREDGMDEEDEWWYGRNAPDSVRPPLEALQDDAVVDAVGGDANEYI